MEQPPDSCEALVARCAGGDLVALAALYDALGAAAYGLARRVTGDDDRAAAVVEAAFLDCWRRAPSFEAEREEASAWLLRLVHRRALEAARRERAGAAGKRAAPAAAATAGAATSQRHAARAALARLEPAERQVLELAYLDGYRQSEIAALLGEPRVAVAGRLHSALARLRDLLVSGATVR